MTDWLLWIPVGVAIGFAVGHLILTWREHRDLQAQTAALKLIRDREDD